MTSGAGASVLRGACYERTSPDHSRTDPDRRYARGTGVGIGLLLADKLTDNERRAAGWALVGVGALTTVPLAMDVLGKHEAPERGLIDARS
jgi:hypothetical protein